MTTQVERRCVCSEPVVLFGRRTTCRVRAGAPSLSGSKHVITRQEGRSHRRFRPSCSDSDVRPCSTTQTHTVILPSACSHLTHPRLQVGLSGLHNHAVLLGGEKQGGGGGAACCQGVRVEGVGVRCSIWCFWQEET